MFIRLSPLSRLGGWQSFQSLKLSPDEQIKAGARQLGLDPEGLEVRSPDEFDAAFGLARQRQAQALYAFATNIVATHRSRLAALAAGNRLPSFSQFPLLAQAGWEAAGFPGVVRVERCLGGGVGRSEADE